MTVFNIIAQLTTIIHYLTIY